MINFTNNKKLNIKINILLAAFLEDEYHDTIDCYFPDLIESILI